MNRVKPALKVVDGKPSAGKPPLEVAYEHFREDTSAFAGRHYTLDGAPSRPLPVQKPHPPLVIGAKRPRMLRIAAAYADTWNASGTPDEMRDRNRRLDEECRRIGRDPD